MEKLNQRRREVLLQRLDHEERTVMSRTSLLETKRVLPTQKHALELKERKVDLLSTAQERRLRETMMWQNSTTGQQGGKVHPRSRSEDEEKALVQETNRIREVSFRVFSTQIKELEAQQGALIESVDRMRMEEERESRKFKQLSAA